MSKKKVKSDEKHVLSNLSAPIYLSHVKPGNTLATNNDLLLLQDGSTTVEIRRLGNLETKKMTWPYGLIRDIVWSSELNVFILLTQRTVFTFNPQSMVPSAAATPTANKVLDLSVTVYSKIQPYEDKHAFWRCTWVENTLYIIYAGCGTIIDEYIIEPTACELINRWTPPQTCAKPEGIWSIRYHPTIDQLGMTIMNKQNNQWRFEIRNRKTFTVVWKTILIGAYGGYELSPLANGEWLAINSYGRQLMQLSTRRSQQNIEYDYELRNVIAIGNDYLIIRTKNTLEIHLIKKKEN